MGDLFGRIFFDEAQRRIEDEQKKPHRFNSLQALILSIFLAAFLTYAFHKIIGSRFGPRESTIVAVFLLLVIVIMSLLDSPSRELSRVILTIGVVLLSFEIIGYEALRYLKKHDFVHYLNSRD